MNRQAEVADSLPEEGVLIADIDSPGTTDKLRILILVFSVALGLRLAYTIALGWRHYQLVADAQDYHFIATALADGKGFSRLGWDLQWRPTAFRPPLTPFLISLIYRVSPGNTLAARVLMCVIGSLAAVLIAVAAALAFPANRSWRIALLAGLLAALSPFLVLHNTGLLIEPAHTLLIAIFLVIILRANSRVSDATFVLLGLTSALLALNRPDGIAYAFIATVWAAAFASGGKPLETRQRMRNGAIVILTFVLACSPWWIRNYRQFQRFIPSTTSTGDLILGANNRATYEPGVFYGYWSYEAVITGEAGAYSFADEITAERKHLELGINYILDHPGQFLAVMPVRVLRGWDLWDPIGNVRFGTSWGRPEWAGYLALIIYYPILVAALLGAIMERRRWRELFPLYAIPIYVTLLFAVSTGEPRYRAAVEPVLVIFAARSGIELAKGTRTILASTTS